MHEGRMSTWSEFTGAFSTEAQGLDVRKGEGLAILSGVTTSPTLIDQMNPIRAMAGREMVHARAERQSRYRKRGEKNRWPERDSVVYDLSQADVIVSLESDFMNMGPATLAYARQFAARRAVDNGQTPCRLYAIESAPSVSGSLADHRFAVKSSRSSSDRISTCQGMWRGNAECAGDAAGMVECSCERSQRGKRAIGGDSG